MAGPKLERYEILEELGQGGMSVVYRARDRHLPRQVAVKVLHDFLAKQNDARQRFHREAVAVAKLHHPGIVEIFDYSGPDREETFIVTELIDGVTLRDFVDKRGAVPYPEIAALLTWDLCRSLKHAHDHGVIHRDLKPENVMVTRDGHLKLMDFGIAQIQDGPRVTMTGTLLGSPAHMAPEVIDGERPDARADLFSLGTLLYWLATGRLPFDAPNPSALFRRILEGRYDDPQQVEPKIGNGLSRIIKKSLEPDRAARYASADELLRDLGKELEAVGLSPPEVVVGEYLRDPSSFAASLGKKLVERLTKAGREALAERNVGRAMDRFNRVLAIDPSNAEVKKLIASVGQSELIRRRAKQALVVSAILGITGAGGYLGASVFAVDLIARGPEAPIDRPMIAPPQPLRVERAPAPAAPAMLEAPPIETPPVLAAASKKTLRRLEAMAPAVGAPDAGTTSAEPPDAGVAAPPPVPEKKIAKLRVRIGGPWANIWIDGALKKPNAYSGTFDLEPGAHTVRVENPQLGALPERSFRVDEQGKVFEGAQELPASASGAAEIDFNMKPLLPQNSP